MSDPIPETDMQWCRVHFSMMVDGGVWAVPRSGLIFTRRGDELVLTVRMPFTAELAEAVAKGADVPETAEALREYQDADYALIASRFEAAGISVSSDVEGETDA